MTEETICCPKCKGLGKVKKPRTRIVSKDPSKKWCKGCNAFLDLNQFYKGSTPCISCYKSIKKVKRFKSTCVICSVQFSSSSHKIVMCSKACYLARQKSLRLTREHELLPNYLMED